MGKVNIDKLRRSGAWRGIDMLVNIILIATGMVITLIIFSTVIARYFLQADIFSAEEAILIIAWWLYFAGSIKGSIEDSHIKVDLLDVYIKKPKAKYGIKVVAKFIEFCVNIVLTRWAFNLLILNFHRMPRTMGLRIPVIIAQFPIAVGFLFMAAFSLYYCLFYLSKCVTPDEIAGGK